MKTYDSRLGGNPACPTGEHELPYSKEGTAGCTCPWLIVQSDTPQMHITTWSRAELDVLIREVDRGTFDPADYPRRAGSRFLSDFVSQLVDVVQRNPVEALMMLMARARIEQVAWDPAAQSLWLGVHAPVPGTAVAGTDWHVMQFTAAGNRRMPTGDVEPAELAPDADPAIGHGPQLLWKLTFPTPVQQPIGRDGVVYGPAARAKFVTDPPPILDAVQDTATWLKDNHRLNQGHPYVGRPDLTPPPDPNPILAEIENILGDPTPGLSASGYYPDEAAGIPVDDPQGDR